MNGEAQKQQNQPIRRDVHDGSGPAKPRKKRASVMEPSGAALSINQAHRLIGKEVITRQALYLAAERGDFPSIRLGRRILIPRAAFEAFLLGAKTSAA